MKTVLKAEPLDQLKLVWNWGAGVDAAGQPWVQKLLGPSGEQKDKFRALAKQLAEAKAKDEALLDESKKKATDQLTADQRTKWEEVAGKPFRIEIRIGN